ncbi:MAG TPA: hypothetical protein VGG28_11245 [Kofleriaceae bacterium]
MRATVHFAGDAMPDIAVQVGAFAVPTFPPPRVSYAVRRHPWA